MKAVDTNVLLRFIMRDDQIAFEQARDFLESDDIFVPITVILELEWVLRASYKVSREERAATMDGLLMVAGFHIQHAEAVSAVEGMRRGMDFADCLHVALSGGAESFGAFDKPFVEMSAGWSKVPVIAPRRN